MWAIIRELVAEGATLLLTTQYLEEADELADAIVVIDHGRIIAQGTPAELKRQVGGARIEVIAHLAEDIPAIEAVLARECQCDVAVDEATRRVSVAAGDQTERLFNTFRELDAAGIAVDDIGLRHPTLDDVFLSLTGHVAEETATTSETHLVHAGQISRVER